MVKLIDGYSSIFYPNAMPPQIPLARTCKALPVWYFAQLFYVLVQYYLPKPPKCGNMIMSGQELPTAVPYGLPRVDQLHFEYQEGAHSP
jgi:hypothetical protein